MNHSQSKATVSDLWVDSVQESGHSKVPPLPTRAAEIISWQQLLADEARLRQQNIDFTL